MAADKSNPVGDWHDKMVVDLLVAERRNIIATCSILKSQKEREECEARRKSGTQNHVRLAFYIALFAGAELDGLQSKCCQSTGGATGGGAIPEPKKRAIDIANKVFEKILSDLLTTCFDHCVADCGTPGSQWTPEYGKCVDRQLALLLDSLDREYENRCDLIKRLEAIAAASATQTRLSGGVVHMTAVQNRPIHLPFPPAVSRTSPVREN